jgi:hypothetical protein
MAERTRGNLAEAGHLLEEDAPETATALIEQFIQMT